MPQFLPTLRRTKAARLSPEVKAVLADYYASLWQYEAHRRARHWPIERAVVEGYERVIWVFKAVNTIAADQARLPFRLRVGGEGGEVLDDHPLYRVLNKLANPLETGQVFRKRLSAQILLSKQGAFVEKTLSNGGTIKRLDLLPPDRTELMPGSGDTLVDHVRLTRRDGSIRKIPWNRVLWFRDPHLLDPYSGVTPLEAAGMSVELDYFARLYNVSFMRNDGRPGGVLGVRNSNGTTTDMDTKAMDRIESRFGKGPTEAGKLSVIQGELSYIDLAARPRDMQYGACVTVDTLITLADGGVKRADEISLGDEVLSWDEETRSLTTAPVSDVWMQPKRSLYRVKTARGRELVTTDNHPYWGVGKWRTAGNRLIGTRSDLAGWIRADQIKVGDQVRVALDWVVKGGMPEDEAWALGVMVGDGHIPKVGAATLCSTDDEILDRFRRVLTRHECVLRQGQAPAIDPNGARRGIDYRISHRDGNARGRKTNPFKAWLREHDLVGRGGASKRVPPQVLAGGVDAWTGFLSGYLDTDGTVAHRRYRNPHIEWSSINRDLLVDCQHLLAMLGVQSRLSEPFRKRGKGIYGESTMYRLTVTGYSQVARTARLLNCAHPEKASRLTSWAKAECSGREYPNDHWLFDRVAEVERLDDDHTIAIEIAGTHTHVTNGIVTHNTSKNSKIELLAAFGVAESVLGYAADRTFANAEQELYNYWTITMPKHSDIVVSGFDEDSEDDLEGFLDTSKIEVLQRAEIARREEARKEFEMGLRSVWSYANVAGMADEIEETPHTRALYISQGKTPLPARAADAAALGLSQPAPSEPAPQRPELESGSGPEAGPGGVDVAVPPEPGGAPGPDPAQRPVSPPNGTTAPGTAPGAAAAALAAAASASTKRLHSVPGGKAAPPGGRVRLRIEREREHPELPAAADVAESDLDERARDRLEDTLAAALAALSTRWVERTIARLESPKARKGTRHWTPDGPLDTRIGTKAVDSARAVDEERWSEEAEVGTEPIIAAAAVAAAAALLADLGRGEDNAATVRGNVSEVVTAVVAIISRAAGRQAELLARIINDADQDGLDLPVIVARVRQYGGRLTAWAEGVATQAATATTNGARDSAAADIAASSSDEVTRTWLSRRDDKVRHSHHKADGQQQPIGQPFIVGDSLLRHPGDPLGSIRETAGCRCHLLHRSKRTGRFVTTPIAAAG